MKNKQKIIEICTRYILSPSEEAVINEPYIPFIPEVWNKVLVLAESQNLSITNDSYVQALKTLTSTERIDRLGNIDKSLNIQPWDDGSIKIAIESAFGISASETGVSNAVFWSQRSNSRRNTNPGVSLQKQSSTLWQEILEVLNPTKIICFGNVAEFVIKNTGWSGETCKLRLPAKTAISRISGMFREADLLNRYPEVEAIIKKHPEWLDGGYTLNKIFFACHAVSLYKG